jgi:AraC-like DNA-binding protein
VAYQITILPPSPPLAEYVLFYAASRRVPGIAPPPTVEILRFPAHMYPSLVIVHSGHIRNAKSGQTSTGSVLMGAMTGVRENERHDGPEVTHVIFKPGRIGDFCRLPASDLTDQWGDSRAVLSANEHLELTERMAAQPTLAQQIGVLENVLVQRFARLAVGPTERLTRALPQLMGRLPHMRVTALAEELGWSTRWLEHHCLNAFGVGPKMLTRLARIQFAGALLQKSNATELRLTDIAQMAGYSDQAHFTRDAHALAGFSPSALRHLVQTKDKAAWGYTVSLDRLSSVVWSSRAMSFLHGSR